MASEAAVVELRADGNVVPPAPLARDPADHLTPDKRSDAPILFIQIPDTGAGAVIDYICGANPRLIVREINSPVSSRDVADARNAQFVHGTIGWADVVKHFAGWRKVTVLRDPALRLYARSVAGPKRKGNGQLSNGATKGGSDPAYRGNGAAPNGTTDPYPVDPCVRQFCDESVGPADRPAGRATIERAKANIASLDFILIADKLSTDLPLLCRRLGLNAGARPPGDGEVYAGEARADGKKIAHDMALICERVAVLAKGDRELYFGALDDGLGAPYVRRNIRPLVAFVSPVFPDEFGVPVYSLLTAKALHRYARLDLINPTPPPAADAMYFNSHIEAPATRRLDGYDRRLFVFGNNRRLHKLALSLAKQARDGVCVYHDAQMLETTVEILGPERARQLAEQRLGRPVEAGDLASWFGNRSKLPDPLLTPIGDGHFIDVVHSPVQRVVQQAFYPQSRPIYLPHAIQHVMTAAQISPIGRMAARAIVGIPIEQIAIASCGSVNDAKRTADTLFALRHLHDYGVKAHLYFIGIADDDAPKSPREVADRLGLAGFVHFSGRVREERYVQYLAASDVAVQLRRPLFGQPSSALMDCIAAALPTVAPLSVAAALEAPSFVVRLPDAYSSLDVGNSLCELISRGRGGVEPDEWNGYLQERSFERYAPRLAACLDI